MDINHLRLFYELILAGSFRKLAAIKNISIAKISRTLTALEKELGYTLIERRQGLAGLHLTPQGQILFDGLPPVLESFDNIASLMGTDPNLNKGHVTIYTTNSIIEDWLVYMLPLFQELYPELILNLQADNNLITPSIKQRILSISPLDEDCPNVCQTPLLDFHVGLWASKEYLQRHGHPKALSDLKRHKIMVFAKEFNQMTYHTINWHLKNLDINVDNLLCINSTPGLMRAAQNGLGIVSLSQENVKAGGYKLERVLPKIAGPTVTMCFTYPGYWKNNKLIKTVEALLVKAFPDFYNAKLK